MNREHEEKLDQIFKAKFPPRCCTCDKKECEACGIRRKKDAGTNPEP